MQAVNRHHKVLELNKILDMLAEQTACGDVAEIARNLKPETEFNSAKRALQQTSDAYMLILRFGEPSFGGLKNISGTLRRAESGGILNMGELLSVAQVLKVYRTLKLWRERAEPTEATAVDEYFDLLTPNRYLEDKITAAIISEEEMADDASPELLDIRRKLRTASVKVREQLEKMVRGSAYQKYLQDQVITIRSGRFVVPVKAEHRGEVPGLVHDTSASGATVFIEPMAVVETNNQIRVLKSKEEAEVERILAQLSGETGGFADAIVYSCEIAMDLNLIFAKAKLAVNMRGACPILNQDGVIRLKKARHPLLDPDKVVPIDIELGETYDTLVITGPNTGGKTVSLKTLGLLTLMAMCGLMIPAEDNSHLSFFEHVLADIGDEQSIEQSLSTFSAHMTNIIEILKVADGQTLVLLDELGAGTDPVEGAALATAILEELRLFGAKVAATTHYAELKAFALDTKGVENACCEFDVDTLSPTYRLLIGVPGRSNAFAISQRLGMTDHVIDRAKAFVSEENARFENVVEVLETERLKMEKEHAQAAELRSALAESSKAAKEYLADAEKQREKMLESAKREASSLVERARAQASGLLGELEQMKKQMSGENAAELVRRARQSYKSGMQGLENTADPVDQKLEKEYKLPRPLKAGDEVLIYDIDKKATVLALPDSSEKVLVQAGIIKTRIPLSNLRLIEDEKKKARIISTGAKGVESRATREVKTEIDLRGKNVEEALLELEQFIDNALLTGLKQLTVIHGKGTGVLRSAVGQTLRRNKSVKTFRLGVFGEGEDGVTIAELK